MKGIKLLVTSLIIILTVAVLLLNLIASNLSYELDKKDKEVDVLEERNATLRDELWNLNQTLMKDSD